MIATKVRIFHESTKRVLFRIFVLFRNFVAKGFSLIEVIIALAIVLTTLTVFGVALSSVPLTKNARSQNLAYHIGAKKVEELRNTPFDSLPAGGAFTDPGFSDLEGASGIFTIANYSGSSSIKQIVVTVFWTDSGKTRSVVLETLMSDKGLNQP